MDISAAVLASGLIPFLFHHLKLCMPYLPLARLDSGSTTSWPRAGMKGGSVQNPIHALAHFIDDLHAPNGSVNVEGFYRCV